MGMVSVVVVCFVGVLCGVGNIGGRDGSGCVLAAAGAVATGGGGREAGFDELIDDDDEEFMGFEDPLIKLRTSSEALAGSSGSLSSGGGFPAHSLSTSAGRVAGDVSFAFHHDLGGRGFQFEPCGEFTVRGKAGVDAGQSLLLFVSRRPWTSEQQTDFLELLKSDGFYRIRVPSNIWKPGNETVMSYVKARCLAAAGFQEHFEFVLDHMGNVVAVNYLLPDGACLSPSFLPPNTWKFTSKAEVKQRIRAIGCLRQFEGRTMSEEGKRKKNKTEKSFFARYWMYIVPGVLIFMHVMAQATATLEQQQQQIAAERGGARPGAAGAHAGGPARRRAVQ